MAKAGAELYISCERQSMRYTVILQKEEDGGYVATVPVLPGCVSQGDTREEALKNIEEVTEVYLEDVRAEAEKDSCLK